MWLPPPASKAPSFISLAPAIVSPAWVSAAATADGIGAGTTGVNVYGSMIGAPPPCASASLHSLATPPVFSQTASRNSPVYGACSERRLVSAPFDAAASTEEPMFALVV